MIHISGSDDNELLEVDDNSFRARTPMAERFDDSSSEDDEGTYHEFMGCATGLEELGVLLNLLHDDIDSKRRQNHGEALPARNSP